MSEIEFGENVLNYSACELDFENVEIFNGYYEEFIKFHLLSNKPCIVPDVTDNWLCINLWILRGLPNFSYLKEHYGHAEVPVANCNEKYFNSQSKTTLQFAKFLDYWEKYIENDYPQSEPCLYMKDWHFTLHFPDNIYRVPPQFGSDWLNEYFERHLETNDDYRFVYMGPKGSWTPFHADVFTSYSWSVNICGQKKWILFPPGQENRLKDKFGNLPYDIESVDLNHFNNGEDKIKFYTVIQNVGDAIFIPSGWFHQVWNMEDTISLNHNWINGCNIENMWKSLKSNLEDVKKEISDLKTVEDWPIQCQHLLKACYGMDYQEFYNFLCYIINSRLEHIQTGKCLEVYGGWKLGMVHSKFDLKRAHLILDQLINDSDAKLLSFNC